MRVARDGRQQSRHPISRAPRQRRPPSCARSAKSISVGRAVLARFGERNMDSDGALDEEGRRVSRQARTLPQKFIQRSRVYRDR